MDVLESGSAQVNLFSPNSSTVQYNTVPADPGCRLRPMYRMQLSTDRTLVNDFETRLTVAAGLVVIYTVVLAQVCQSRP